MNEWIKSNAPAILCLLAFFYIDSQYAIARRIRDASDNFKELVDFLKKLSGEESDSSKDED